MDVTEVTASCDGGDRTLRSVWRRILGMGGTMTFAYKLLVLDRAEFVTVLVRISSRTD
jgi:hypothetical protein